MNTQNNSLWKNDKMAVSEYQLKTKNYDTLGKFGCIVTCLSNIYEHRHRKTFTPKMMNERIKENAGYKGLRDINTPESQYSFIIWDVIEKIFDVKITEEKKTTHDIDSYYIARILLDGGGHYVNVISNNDEFVLYDVYMNTYKKIKNVTKLIKMGFQ